MSDKINMVIFESVTEGLIPLRQKLISGMSEELADEVLKSIEDLRAQAFRHRTCPFCGVSV